MDNFFDFTTLQVLLDSLQLKAVGDPTLKSTGKVGTRNPVMLGGLLEEAFNSIGLSTMSDGFAAKLLAYLYVFGGGNEAVVYHEGLRNAIAVAQQKANLYGGEVPNTNMVLLLQQYIKELEAAYVSKNDKGSRIYKDFAEVYKAVDWLDEIFSRYELLKPNANEKTGSTGRSSGKHKNKKRS